MSKILKILEKENTKKIDVISINDKPCILRFGLGYDSDIIGKTPQSLKNKFGYFSYFIAGILFALRLMPQKYHITYDNNEIDADGKPTGFGAGFGSGFGGGFGGASNPFGQGFSSRSGASGNPFGANGFDFSSIFGEDIMNNFTSGNRGGGYGFGDFQKGPDDSYTIDVGFVEAARGAEKIINLNNRNINLKIPAGTQDGQTLRLKGLGSPSYRGGVNGDVLVTVKVRPHRYFQSSGLNVLLELPISIKEAILGAQITVPTIHGNVNVKIPPYSSSGEKLRLKEKVSYIGGKKMEEVDRAILISLGFFERVTNNQSQSYK